MIEKYGVSQEILYEDLRNEEARLMQRMQDDLTTKTASQQGNIELQLQQIRNKITELDLKKN
jgi:hypothetical protein